MDTAVLKRDGFKELTIEMTLNGDNESSLALTRNPAGQSRTKHIDEQHHYIRDIVEKEPLVAWVLGANILADSCMEALPIDTFKRHRPVLGLG